MKWNSSESLKKKKKTFNCLFILILLNQLGDWRQEVGRQREKTNVYTHTAMAIKMTFIFAVYLLSLYKTYRNRAENARE